MRVAVVALVASCAGSTGHRGAAEATEPTPPSGSYASPPTFTPFGMNVPTLAAQCDSGNGNSCVVLGNAFESGDSTTVEGAYRSPVGAVQYWLKGCRIGDPSGCYSAGSALLTGAGVEKDVKTAAAVLRQSCDTDSYKNMMQGFGCGDAAKALLALDAIGNYNDAMRLLDKACTLQAPLCELKAQYVGTGLRSETEAPTGAVGFSFGDSFEKARRVCGEGGGTMSATIKGATFCVGYNVPALEDAPKYVALDFCGTNVCGVTIAVSVPNYMAAYLALGKRLRQNYGTPGDITRVWPVECKKDAQLIECLHHDRARFSLGWQWKDGTQVLLHINAHDGDAAVLLVYGSPALTQAHRNDGL